MKDPIALAVLRHFAELNESQISIEVDSLVSHVPNFENTRQRIIQFLKLLAAEKWGTFTTGRRGHKSRFEAPRGLRTLSRLLESTTDFGHASNQQASPPPRSDDVGPSDNGVRTSLVNQDATIKTLTHNYILRPNYSFSIVLPVDLTENEASRLSEFIKSLPFQ
jgi:hypothetical protein